MKLLICTSLFLTSISMFYSCKSTSKAVLSKPKYNLDLLYRVWDVDSIIVGGKSASGYVMGDPQYEFTREGKRIKSFKVPPHSESVSFFIRNDSIHYSAEKALPSSAIVELTEKTLVLENEKAVWKLCIK